MTRAEGRNRSEIDELNARLKALAEDLNALSEAFKLDLKEPAKLSHFTAQERAFLFTLESYASTLFQRLRAELFERRYEMPKSDSDVFAILQKNDVLDLVEARKIRQFCEARRLSERDLTKIDLPGLLGAWTESVAEIRSILDRLN